ncbi:MAG TPA: ABC transporter permease [Gemmatimonadaceae bacterium]|nr:ABC transporter permease [Gemmatimonadaceae bacterium]
MLFSLASLIFVVVPLYFVARALQPTMASSIASQSQQYFAFVLIGSATLTLISASASALPNAVASAIGRGTLEAFLSTPTHPALLLGGMSAYGVLWAVVRAAILVAAGAVLGVRIAWANAPAILALLALLIVCYAAFGLIASAMLLCFRTTGPLLSGLLSLSALLGGVYYPTHVIPSWIQQLSNALPLTYGLRALRQSALLGVPVVRLGHDMAMLAGFAVFLLLIGTLTVAAALRFAKRAGTLSQY